MPPGRSGTYVRQPSGYRAFVPKALPPVPPLRMTGPLVAALSDAGLSLGRLDAGASLLRDPDLVVGSFVQKEALLSSQIEGTQATLDDVLASARPAASGVEDVVNYVAALNLGLERLKTLPLSLRLVREVHARLLRGVRGGERTPGEFRRSQNWVGGGAVSLAHAAFVPPPPHEMSVALDRWERYLVRGPHAPELVKCALLHAQFETIHPFLDGNGRVGRLLVTFLLHQWGLLRRPVLYLSLWFKRHRTRYYHHLQAIRDEGAWEEWTEFFLVGVAETAQEAARSALAIADLREKDLARVRARVRSRRAPELLDSLFVRPVVDVAEATKRLGVSQPTANAILGQMEEVGVLEETTGRAWGRRFRYAAYLNILRAGTTPLA